MKQVLWWILIIFEIENMMKVVGNLDTDILKKLEDENGTLLSRKRRYLTFPEGSSFQVVFDLTYPSVGMGNAFVFGNTAAMGFELPSTPIFLDKKKMSKEEDEEKSENKTMEKVPANLDHSVDYQHYWQPPLTLHNEYEDPEDWQHTNDFIPNYDSSYDPAWPNIDRSPVTSYSNPFGGYVDQHVPQKLTPVNRAYQKYYGGGRPSNFWHLDRNYRKYRVPLRLNVMPQFQKTVTHHVHRRSRREIYTKIEKLFTALSKDGKVCILKAICQVNKIPKNKGSMWQEIIKAIFRVKPNDLYPDEDHYDKAANRDHDCETMYPECDGHVLSKLFNKKKV